MYDIKLQGITKKFDAFTAVNDINFTIPKSSVTVLLGPSGCGKTTLMRMIAGLESPTEGRIFFDEHDVTDVATRRRNIGMVFQYPVIYRGTSVRKNLELPLLSEKLSKAEMDKRVDEVAEILGLQDVLKRQVEELDNGTRQKIAVGREVARQPKIILFDEPITNIDLTSKLELKRSLKELFGRLKQTIVYVTHDQTEAMTLADQIALMQDGVITQCDSPKEIYDLRKNNTLEEVGEAVGMSRVQVRALEQRYMAQKRKREALAKKIKELTGGMGTTMSIDTGGTTESIDGCINVAAVNGKVALIGIPEADFVTYNPHRMRTKELTIKNVRRSNQTLDDCVKNYTGDNEIEGIISHEFDFNDIQQAFDTVADYKDQILKCIIKNN